jgi:TonB-linked SusC/RagA family outer membrane protein
MFVLLVMFCSLNVQQVFSQNANVTGTITDASGEQLKGASVMIKGTTSGVVSDEVGRYTINVPDKGSVLIFSFIGYVTKEVVYNGETELNVTLDDESLGLDEVVVVAYGVARKSTFTGSASVVKSEQISKISAVGVMESLQGMTAGVNITNNEGNPGGFSRIQIRGIASMRDDHKATVPLYVVDGVPYDGDIVSLTPSDIETMTILKDAAASSLYGSRAAHGVVMITTKKGKAGKPVVNFRAAWGTSDNAVKNPVKADPYQTMLYMWQANYTDGVYLRNMSPQAAGDYATSLGISQAVAARTNSQGQTVYVSPFKSVPLDQYVLHDGNGNPYVNPNLEMVWEKGDYDFYGAVFSRKLRQDYSMDVSGASSNNKTNYYFSLSHLNDNGYSGNQYYKRYSFRSNISSEITGWLTMGGNLAYSYARQKGGGSNRMLVFSNSLNSPWLRNADNTDWEYSLKTGSRMKDYGTNVGEFFGIHSLDGMHGQGDYWNNPDDYNFSNDEHGMVTAHYFAEFTLPFDIKFKTNVNYDDISKRNYYYGSAVHGEGQLEPYGVTVTTDGGTAQRQESKTRALTWNNLLTFDKTFGDHNINLLAGQEYYSNNQSYMMGIGYGIMSIGMYEVKSATRDWRADSYNDRYTLLSFFGRAEYNFRNKYYLSGSVRSDGSSRFHPDQRWGSFFSFGASWKLSQEAFLSDISWLNNLSLRGSYGTSGNDNVGVLYAYQEYYESYNLYGQPGYRKKSNGANDLHWEKNKQINVALDFAILKKLSGTIEYYTRNSEGLLASKELPLSANAGAATVNTNLGDIVNRGFEFSLSLAAIENKDFRWNVSANFSTLHNEVTMLAGGDYIFDTYRSKMKRAVGHSLFEHFLPRNAGVNPENGRLMYWIQDGNNNWRTTENFNEVDFARDGQFVGSAIPKGFGSITNSFAYKGIDFSFMWYGSYGAKIYSYQLLENYSIRSGVSVVPDVVDGKVWMKPGDNAQFPRWSMTDRSFAGQNNNSDLFIVSNDFLRLRNLTLGYTLPKKITQKVGMSNARFYVSGDNLLTFSPVAKYYVDPESGLKANDYNGNGETDSGIQGARRVYMFGIQLSF